MPIPLVLAGVVGGVGAVFGSAATAVGSTAGRAYIKRQLNRHEAEIKEWALSAVFEKLGLPDLMTDGGLNRAAFTDQINKQFLSGQDFQFSDIFSSEAIKKDALRLGIKQVGQEAGLKVEHPTLNGMRDALRAYVIDLVGEELTAQDVGELTQDARDIYEIVMLYRKYKKAEADGAEAENGGRRPLINTPEAAANRERQARYRANHKKVWVAK